MKKGDMTGYSIRDMKLAYIAGIVDGEGYIGIDRRGRLGIHPTILVANTDRRVLEFIKDMFGGRVTARNSKPPRCRVCYAWIRSCLPVAGVLEQLLPYLIIKKEQALLAIQLITAPAQREEEIACRIQELNQGGGGKK